MIDKFCLELYVERSSYEDEVLYQIFLGKTLYTDLGDVDLKSFQKMWYLHVTKLPAEYNRAMKYAVADVCILTISSANYISNELLLLYTA